MNEKVFHFVRNHEVAAFERVGWVTHPALNDTHHGQWSTLMEWCGEGEPVKPFFIDSVEAHNAEAIRAANERAAWRDTIERELVTPPPVDPDAEQLAAQVGALNDDLQRGAA